MGSQSEILFHEILDVQMILVDGKTFFFLALKFGRKSLKKHTVYMGMDGMGCMELDGMGCLS